MRRNVLWILFILSLIILFALVFKTVEEEGTWICQNGAWVKSGHPSFAQPETACSQVQLPVEIETIDVKPEIDDTLMEVTVFFGNIMKDPETLNCGNTYQTDRQILSSADKYSAVMAELLQGPNDNEKALGFFTSINASTTLPHITFSGGVLALNFSSDIENSVGGSCRVSAIRSQIENTFKQFPEVKEVIIAVNGRVDDVLQP
ncbi:MAG: GerMN domain-containing protein [Candidatus Falkowbacteria bacterium]